MLPGEKVVQQYGDAGQHEILIRFPQTHSQEQGFGLEASSQQAIAAIEKANIGKFDVLSTEVVGPVVGKDLQRKGIYATLASILGISLYIALRFRLIFAVGALVATFHDIFVVLAMMSFAGLRALAERRRGDPDDCRIFGERHDRHLRPRAREHALDAA